MLVGRGRDLSDAFLDLIAAYRRFTGDDKITIRAVEGGRLHYLEIWHDPMLYLKIEIHNMGKNGPYVVKLAD